MRIRAALMVVAVFWALSAWALGDQFDPTRTCRDDAGRFMPCEEIQEKAVVPIVDPFPAGPAPGYEAKPDSDFAMDAGLGAVASLSSEASSGEPTGQLSVSFDVATNEKSPRASLLAIFGALPGQTVSFADPTTFRSLGIEGALSQPLWSNLRVRPAVVVGAEFRFSGEQEPLHRAARYGYLGARVEGEDGYLFLGVGGDERLSTSDRATPAYLPAANVSWRLRLGKITGAIDAALVGRVLLYLRVGYRAADAGSDVAQIGVLVAVGGKR